MKFENYIKENTAGIEELMSAIEGLKGKKVNVSFLSGISRGSALDVIVDLFGCTLEIFNDKYINIKNGNRVKVGLISWNQIQSFSVSHNIITLTVSKNGVSNNINIYP